MASPSPVLSSPSVDLTEVLRKGSKIWASSADGMPWPWIVMIASLSRRCALTRMVVCGCEYLQALLNRLLKTCSSFSSSSGEGGSSSGIASSISICLRSAKTRLSITVRVSNSRKSTGARASSRLPDSNFEISSNSLTIPSMNVLEVWMCCKNERCSAPITSVSSFSNSSLQVATTPSGLRRSWPAIPRNWFFCSSGRSSLAFCLAIFRWAVANSLLSWVICS